MDAGMGMDPVEEGQVFNGGRERTISIFNQHEDEDS